MKIGELARQANCPVETVRYYEKEGLLHLPLRDSVNNYRHYDSSHLERLLFIRRCRALDMTHDEIRGLLQALSRNDEDCRQIDDIVNEHLHHVQQRIQELLALEHQLKTLSDHCGSGRPVSECGIVHTLTRPRESEETLIPLNQEHPGGVHRH